jgi:hypothetical protein
MSETSRCSFIECTDSSSHSNSAHYCKKCNERGHCKDFCFTKSKKRKLSQSKDCDNVSNRSIKTRWEIDGEIERSSSSSSSSATLPDCENVSNRSIKTRWEIDGEIERSSSSTTLPDYEYAKNEANKKFFRYIFKKMYTCIPVGMGCMYLFKISDDILESLFMHSDDWFNSNKITEKKIFIDGYREIM